jgi:hypothetical protein
MAEVKKDEKKPRHFTLFGAKTKGLSAQSATRPSSFSLCRGLRGFFASERDCRGQACLPLA